MRQNQEQKQPATILVVEDDDAIGTFITEAIAQETPHTFVLATHSLQALEIVSAIKPDLFILNYHLPQWNGIELYDRLHAIAEFEHVPAIMVSAILPLREVQRRSIIGIKKPFDLTELLDAIEQLLAP
jgi:DNA-binding response OmpR family regulator